VVESELSEERCVFGNDALAFLFAEQSLSVLRRGTNDMTHYSFSSAMASNECYNLGPGVLLDFSTNLMKTARNYGAPS
jgi:hypothetical protein